MRACRRRWYYRARARRYRAAPSPRHARCGRPPAADRTQHGAVAHSTQAEAEAYPPLAGRGRGRSRRGDLRVAAGGAALRSLRSLICRERRRRAPARQPRTRPRRSGAGRAPRPDRGHRGEPRHERVGLRRGRARCRRAAGPRIRARSLTARVRGVPIGRVCYALQQGKGRARLGGVRPRPRRPGMRKHPAPSRAGRDGRPAKQALPALGTPERPPVGHFRHRRRPLPKPRSRRAPQTTRRSGSDRSGGTANRGRRPRGPSG